MRWRPVIHTVADAISGLNKDPPYQISVDILKGLDENDFIHVKHMHFNRVLSQLFQANTDLSTSERECFANIKEALEDIAFQTRVMLPHNGSTVEVLNITVKVKQAIATY